MIFRSLILRILGLLPLSVLIAGCAVTPGATPSPTHGLAIRGNVHGGQQPIAGAHVYLFAADVAAFGNPSVSLLNAGATGFFDGVGAYVPTGADGSWDITNDYSCTPNTQLYLYVLGGDPGAGINSASGLLAAVGSCSGSGTFPTNEPYVWINEVSTVAAAYAMAPYAVDALHVGSSGSPLALTGIANAFANAANLADLASGSALATTPNGNGAVPQTEINLLANILAACVNSEGPGSTNCSMLLQTATSDGTPGGINPSDTASAMINIAHNPGSNIVNLFTLPPPAAAFGPALSLQPSDFTLAVTYTGTDLNAPGSVSIDASGNVWIANSGTNSVSLLSSLGVPLPNSPFWSPNLSTPNQIAIDNHGNAWVANSSSPDIAEFDPNGNFVNALYTTAGNMPADLAVDNTGDVWAVSPGNSIVTELLPTPIPSSSFTPNAALNSPDAIAIDHAGNIWIANQTTAGVTVLNNGGQTLSTLTGDGISMPGAISIDAASHAWIANFDTSSVSVIDISGQPYDGSPFSGGGLTHPVAMAFDGAGNVWFANSGASGVTEFTSNAAVVTGSPFGGSSFSQSKAIAVDGSGSVWVADQTDNKVVQIIGSAVPAVTPLATAVTNGTTGARP